MSEKGTQTVEDWVDVWFEIQGELGLDLTWRLGWTNGKNAEPHWIEMDHRHFDGVGGMAATLRGEGWPLAVIPSSSDSKRPGIIAILLELVRQEVARRSLGPVPWRVDTGVQSTATMRRCTQSLNEEQTKAVLRNARDAGVSVNTFLLYHLNCAVERHLIARKSDNVWVVPVNLRGPILRREQTSNHVSFFPIRITPKISLSELNMMNQRRLKRGAQWLSWSMLNFVGRKKGRPGVAEIVRKNLETQRSVVGVFSNLGSWPQENDRDSMAAHAQSVGEDRTFYICPNNTPSVPVAGGAVTWFGRMGLSVQVHPRVSSDQTIGLKIMSDWVGAILMQSRET